MRWSLLCPLLFSWVVSGANVLTQHNDNFRTGANLREADLTPALLKSGRFGKLFSLCVNGHIYAQPLIVTGLELDGKGVHDVVLVATMENNVYAFDAKDGSPLWNINLGPPVPYREIPQGITTIGDTYNIRQWIGITSTPVVDPDTRRLYAVAKIKESEKESDKAPADSILYRLFSIDISSGRIVHSARIDVHQNGQLIRDFAFRHSQRPGLLLSKGLVYVAFGAHQDPPIQDGWIVTYSAETLEQQGALCITPGGEGGGIWQAGNGPAADDDGNVYVMTGNGDFNRVDRFANSFVKFSRDLKVVSSFTPANYRKLDLLDIDLGSAGPVLLPGTDEMVGGGKDGRLFVLSRSDLGGLQRHCFWRAFLNPPLQFFLATRSWRLTATSWIPGLWHEGYHHIHGSPVFWRSEQAAFLYVWGEEDNLKAFRYDAKSHFDTKPLRSRMRAAEGMPGGILSVSANGNRDGIVWSAMPLSEDAFIATVRGVLRAFDATTLEPLWNTDSSEPDDNFSFAKFCPPTIANGRVYLPTFSDRLNVYGIRPGAAQPQAVDRKRPRNLHRRRRH